MGGQTEKNQAVISVVFSLPLVCSKLKRVRSKRRGGGEKVALKGQNAFLHRKIQVGLSVSQRFKYAETRSRSCILIPLRLSWLL
jgi:hypothetical protein